MKLKPWHLVVISISIVVVSLLTVFLITRVFMDPQGSWWWFFSVLILECLIGVIIGVVFLVRYLRGGEEVKTRANVQDAVVKAVEELKNDPYDPDNFLVKQRILRNEGVGEPTTPVLTIIGKGTEMNDAIVCVVNLNNLREKTWLRNPKSDEEVRWASKLLADKPERDVPLEITRGVDLFGRPHETIKTRKVSREEKERQEEKEVAEVADAF